VPVSPGTLAGGLQALAPLLEPILEALYCRQTSERLFHNDETRWEVFVEIAGKVGTRWYLWVTCSSSVVFYCIDPSRSAAVPGAPAPVCRMTRSLLSATATAPTMTSPG
jgi:transposase